MACGRVVVAQLGERLVEDRGIGAVGDAGDAVVDAGAQVDGCGIRPLPEHQVRHRRHAGAQVGARHLAGLVGVGRQVDDVVEQLEGDAGLLAEDDHRLLELRRPVGEDDAGLRGGRDERAGLVGEHLQVELDAGHRPRWRSDRLVHLPEHEPLERVGLQPDRAVAVARHDLARAGEQQVAGEDGDAVAPDRVGAGHAAALVGGIHHVVVVERAEVGHLERRGAVDDLVGRAVAELGGQQREHRAHALAAGVVEVAARGVGERVGDAQLALEARVDALEAGLDGLSRRRDRAPAKMRSVRPSLPASRASDAEGVTAHSLPARRRSPASTARGLGVRRRSAEQASSPGAGRRCRTRGCGRRHPSTPPRGSTPTACAGRASRGSTR